MSDSRWPTELDGAIERNSKTCSCGARIAFAKDYKGSEKRMPIDLRAGQVVLVAIAPDPGERLAGLWQEGSPLFDVHNPLLVFH